MKKTISVFLAIIILITGTGFSSTIFAASNIPSVNINALAGKPGGFAVSWKRKSNINGYQIQYSTSNKFPNGGYKLIDIANPDCYGKTVTGCMSNRTYYVRLRTYKNVNNKKQFSAWSSAKPVATRHRNEAADTTITSLSGRPGGYYLAWKQVANATGYQIQHSTSSKFPSGGTKTTTVNGSTVTAKQIAGCMSNRTYYVRIRTYRTVSGQNYYSAWSNIKSIATRHRNEANPTYITYTTAFTTSFNVTWRKESTAQGYQLQYSTDKRFPSNNCTYLYIDGTDSTSKTVSKLKSGATYYVRIRSRKVVDGKRYYSEFSSAKTVNLSQVSVKSISITDPKGQTVEKGRKIKLHAQVSPSNAVDKSITWKTSDKTKATVDANGIVTAIRPTEYVLITATSNDGGFIDSYELKITANTGYLTKSDLDKLNLSSVNNLMIVAHPDDETLWGGAHLIKDNYFVVVLTNSYKEQRKSEFQQVMKQTNDKYIIMSYPDLKNTWYDENNNYKYSVDTWSTCRTGIQKDLELILNYKEWDTIVTHNPNGEYGHIQHQNISKKVTDIVTKSLSGDQEFYYFGNWYSKKANNPDPKLDDTNYKKKNSLVDVYLPSSPYAIANNRHMVQYENWIKYQDWNNKKSY